MPIFPYFLIVGSALTSLQFYADNVMAPSQLPIRVSQKIGLAESYKAPVIVAAVGPSVEVNNPIKAARKHKPARVVRQSVPQQRYAAYPTREYGSSW